MKLSHRRKARRLALQALYQWQLTNDSPLGIRQQFLEANDMQKVDIDYFDELVKNIPASAMQLDEIMLPTLDRPLKDLNPVELVILRMAIYELTHRLEIPYRVIINEALELTKTFGATEGFKYVNGVLDSVARKLRATEISPKQ